MIEQKFLPAKLADLKFFQDSGKFSGYASTFNNVDLGGDVIMPGAYKASLKTKRDSPLLLYFQHDYRMPIGKVVEEEEDDVGLKIQGELTPNHREASDVAAGIKHGTIWGMSVGIVIPPDGAKRDEKSGMRFIKRADLKEVSLTNMPMNRQSRVTLDATKSVLDACKGISDFEDFLREAGGFSREAAKAALSRFRAVILRDAGSEDEQKSGTARLLDMIQSHTLNILKE